MKTNTPIKEKIEEETHKQDISKKEYFVFLIILIIILLTPTLFTLEGFISFKETGQIGDTIGGITAPFVNLLAAGLVYKSFKAQVDSNNRQLKAMKAQKEQHDSQMTAILQSNSFEQINNLYTRFINTVEKDNQKHKHGNLSMFEAINFHIEYAIAGDHHQVARIEEKLVCATRHLIIGKRLLNEMATRLNSDQRSKHYFIIELAAYVENLEYSKYKDELSKMLSPVTNQEIKYRPKLQKFLDAVNDLKKTLRDV